MPDTVVVFAGGSAPTARALAALPVGAPVIAADRGAEYALAHGLRVELAVGDFDSITPAGLAALERSGARVDRHPPAKELTDLELALSAALAFEPRRILVIGGTGGRLDHLLGELLLFASEPYAAVEVDALLGRATVNVVRVDRSLAGRAGQIVTLLAAHGPAVGVRTEGLVYPLRDETLAPGSSRGVSNVFESDVARVTLEAGVLLVVRPGA
jgi:thiamine pyrophosphokinase